MSNTEIFYMKDEQTDDKADSQANMLPSHPP